MSEQLQTNPLNALTMQQLEQLEQAGIEQDKIIYVVHLTAEDKKAREIRDTYDTYVVVEDMKLLGGCAVYGWSDGYRAVDNRYHWIDKPATLGWLVKHLVERVNGNGR